jgi:hypothetical protein
MAGHRVTVYESRLAALFAKNKNVARFGERFARKAVQYAKEMTPGDLPPDPRPWKSEHLRERNRHRGYLRAGKYLGQIILENDASYAKYAWRRGPVWANGWLPGQGLQVPRVHVSGGRDFPRHRSDKGFIYPRVVGPHWDEKEHWLRRAVYKAVNKF